MLKKTIRYTDYEGNERIEDYYFNLNKPEMLEMQASTSGGMEAYIQRITQEQDHQKLLSLFKDIILKSYGEKSPDGKRFIKIDEHGNPLSIGFMQTEAYSELFMELASDENAASAFMTGILPQGLAEEVAAMTTPRVPAHDQVLFEKPTPLPHQQG